MRTNSKEVKEKIKQHILESVYDENGEEFNSFNEASEHLSDEFKRVADYPYNLKRIPNNQERFTDYLRGIPFNFEYMDYKIEEFLNELGINPQNKEFTSDQMWKTYGHLIWAEISPKYNNMKTTKKNIFLTGGDLDNVMFQEGGDLDNVMFEEGGDLDGVLFAKGGKTLPRLKKGDNVTILGRRWFQKTYGNTYHSVEVFVNNVLIGSNPFSYGYGDGYQQTGMEILQSNFKMPAGFREMQPNATLREAGINVVNRVTDVNAKRELEEGGVVEALVPERDLDVPFAKGGTVGLLAKLMETNTITEKEMNLLKSRLNSNKVDPETQEIIDYIWNNDVVCDADWAKKGIDFLKNQWKSPTGKERLNNPFGYREQEVLANFGHMELAGFYDISRYGGAKFFVPLYDCCDQEGYCFQYYYDGKISIVGKMGGLFGMLSPRSKESWKRDRLWTSQQKHEQAYKAKRKSAIRNHAKDSRLDSQEIHEIRNRRKRKS